MKYQKYHRKVVVVTQDRQEETDKTPSWFNLLALIGLFYLLGFKSSDETRTLQLLIYAIAIVLIILVLAISHRIDKIGEILHYWPVLP